MTRTITNGTKPKEAEIGTSPVDTAEMMPTKVKVFLVPQRSINRVNGIKKRMAPTATAPKRMARSTLEKK